MIRRDYLVRMVQELAQALARILFLKKTQDYPTALQEIERVLAKFWSLTGDQIKSFSVEEWIALCRQEAGAMGDKLIALADLLREQALLYAAEGKASEGQPSAATALGLYLEAVATPETVISIDLLDKIEGLISITHGLRMPAVVLKRLLGYFEARGKFDKAEDVLFEWLDSGDPKAPAGGLAFYGRLTAKSDRELDQCGLPRDEVEQGRAEFLKRSRTGLEP